MHANAYNNQQGPPAAEIVHFMLFVDAYLEVDATSKTYVKYTELFEAYERQFPALKRLSPYNQRQSYAAWLSFKILHRSRDERKAKTADAEAKRLLDAIVFYMDEKYERYGICGRIRPSEIKVAADQELWAYIIPRTQVEDLNQHIEKCQQSGYAAAALPSALPLVLCRLPSLGIRSFIPLSEV